MRLPPKKIEASARVLTELREAVQNGNVATARRLLRYWRRAKLPREHAREVALFARQSGEAMLAIRVLRPYVRPSKPVFPEASAGERAEYAVCLNAIGARDEAAELLAEIDPSKCAAALLYRAFVAFSQWDYASAIEPLRRYLASPGLDEGQGVRGRLNLAAALVYERHPEQAGPVLEILLRETAQGPFRRFHANALELAAQNAILGSRWKPAEDFLDRSQSILKSTGTEDELFVDKWRVVLELHRRPSPAAKRKLAAIRARAEKLNHWETIRDCDRWRATRFGDRVTLHHVYFGTPYRSFRERLLRDFPAHAAIPDRFDWALTDQRRGAFTLDLRSAIAENGTRIKSAQLLHQLLCLFSTDFYAPFRLSSIFSRLWPSEHFDPATSSLRVHQAIKRLRQELRRKRIPLVVRETHGEYRLLGRGPCILRVPREPAPPARDESLLEQLATSFGNREFSVPEAAEQLGLAPRTARLLLSQAVSEKRLARSGQARATRYRFG